MKILGRVHDDADHGMTPVEAVPSAGMIAANRPTVGKSADTILTLKKSLFDFGRERALSGRDTRANEAGLRTLEEHAEAMAREQGATLYDPKESIHDQLRQEKFDKAKGQIPKLEGGVALAAEDVRKRRDAVAELGEVPAAPQVPWWLVCIGTILIGLTMAPTLHDYFFFDIDDVRLGWVLAVSAGSMAGLLISWCLLATFDSTSRVGRWVGLVAGVVFSVALLLMRLVGGESTSSLVLAVGLALFEMAVVLVMDWVGGGLRAQYTEYKAKSEEYDRRLKLLQAAEWEQAYQEGLLKEQEAVTEDHVEHVRDRESRVRQLDSLVRGARQAVRDGYMAGLVETEGRIHGRG